MQLPPASTNWSFAKPQHAPFSLGARRASATLNGRDVVVGELGRGEARLLLATAFMLSYAAGRLASSHAPWDYAGEGKREAKGSGVL